MSTKTEEYLERRHAAREADLAEWESDAVFLELAAVTWPDDFDKACKPGYRAQSARDRLRLRWQGYRAIERAKEQVEGLGVACRNMLEKLKV
jgi:hypothetical protein